jgi:hypothetical protein
MRDLIFRTRFRWQLRPRQVTGDTKYGTTDNIVAMEREHIHAYVPIADLTRAARLSFVKRTSTMTPSAISTSVQQAKNCTWIDRIRPSVRCAIEHVPRSAITARSKHSVPPANKGGLSVAVWRRSIWIESEATMRPKLTRRPIANAVCGSNRYLRKAKTGMACDASAYGSTGRVNCEALMRAAGQNLKRLLKKRGWGRRPYPAEAVCAFFLAASGRLIRHSLASEPVFLLMDLDLSHEQEGMPSLFLMSFVREFFNRLHS